MPIRFFRRYLPRNSRELDRDGSLRRVIGGRVVDANVWRLDRRSISGGMAIGLFVAWVPLPFQMVIAALLALALRVNLPLAVLLVWISNPVTWAPMYWSAYRLGIRILGDQPMDVDAVDFEPEPSWFFDEMLAMWQPLLLGCGILAVASALAGYAVTRLVWRLRIVSILGERRRQRRSRVNRNHDRES